jgi:Protein of unknown function (DUF1573)
LPIKNQIFIKFIVQARNFFKMKRILSTGLLLGLFSTGLWAQSTVTLKSEPRPGAPGSTATPGGKVKSVENEVATVSVSDSIPPTTIAFEHDTYDFGQIKQGEKVKHEFYFTNTGPNLLVIENVKPTCGCTAVDWTKDPVPPGGRGRIEAQFNSAGKMGAQLKHVTVVYNGEPKITRVTFTGEVVAADGATPVPAPTPAQDKGQ